MAFPALGEEKTTPCLDHDLTWCHGTSLRLMASCSAFLNESQEFNNVDPERDWKKWASRVPDAFTLYYSALTDPFDTSSRGVHCVLRAVLDGWSTPTPPHNRRLIIDYIACRSDSRRVGLASTLVRHARESASAQRANLYVLAVEDSCAWWMDRGFVLEDGANLNARLKVFPDVHLLRQKGDPCDQGSTVDLSLPQADDVDAEDASEEEEESSADEGDASENEDDDFQLALALYESEYVR